MTHSNASLPSKTSCSPLAFALLKFFSRIYISDEEGGVIISTDRTGADVKTVAIGGECDS